MNKKYMMFGIPLLCLTLVSAMLISHYGSVSQEINIESPIEVSEYTATELSGILQSPVLGGLVSAENKATFDVQVEVISEATEDGESSVDIATSYVNTLILTKKEITTWEQIEGSEIEISYTVVGDTFEYEVISGSIPIGYELVYAMDKDDRFVNFASVILVGDVDGDMPYSSDWNADADPGYCDGDNGFDSYDYCKGAKLWIVKASDLGTVDSEGVYPLSWANMADYYYETDLVYYFKTVDGVATIPSGVSMEFYPQYEFGAIDGSYIVTTNILPA